MCNGNEIEVKLLVSEQYSDFFSQEISSFLILNNHNYFLENVYYDTQDLFFAKHKMGLRIRRENNHITQTLKTNGKVLGGLHSRPEYNIELSEMMPDLSKMKNIYPEYDFLPTGTLHPVFSTNFHRHTWLVDTGNGTEIEIALDRGNVIAGERKQPINEIEFELKQGNVENLLGFIKQLKLENNIRLSATSKAKRGYLLSSSKPLVAQNWLEKWRAFLEEDNTNKIDNLFILEQELIEETFILEGDFFQDSFIHTVERISIFFNLFLYYSDNKKLLQEKLVRQQEKGILYLDDSSLMNIIDANQCLLDKLKEIIQLHSETKNNLLAMNKLFELLQTGYFLKRQLDLILLTL